MTVVLALGLLLAPAHAASSAPDAAAQAGGAQAGAGQPVAVTQTRPYGCGVHYAE